MPERTPPPFIALRNAAHVSGYARADRIEALVVTDGGTQIILMSGATEFSAESPDVVFAKMADALHIDGSR